MIEPDAGARFPACAQPAQAQSTIIAFSRLTQCGKSCIDIKKSEALISLGQSGEEFVYNHASDLTHLG